MHVEDILITTIPSPTSEEQSAEARVSNAVIEQNDRFRFRKYAFELFNKRFLSVKVERLYRLDPDTQRSPSARWWCLTAVLALFLAAVLVGATENTDYLTKPAVLALQLSAGAVLAMLLVAYHCNKRTVFYSRNGRVPLVALLNRGPDSEAFQVFIEVLIKYIKETGDRRCNGGNLLSEELKEHRRLMEAGFISKKRYASAKRRILALHR